jgi:F-type H+-transporting ATPase subunit delta
MRQPKVAQRYAKALFDLALEKGQLEEVKNDLEDIKAINIDELRTIWMSPVIQGDKKQKIFAALLDGKISVITSAFFNLLFKKGREVAVDEIYYSFLNMYRKHYDIQIVQITTAKPVSEDVNAYIVSKLRSRDKFKDSKLEVSNVIDDGIIGGFILHVDDELYDASIRHDLKVIKTQFIENMYVQKLR